MSYAERRKMTVELIPNTLNRFLQHVAPIAFEGWTLPVRDFVTYCVAERSRST